MRRYFLAATLLASAILEAGAQTTIRDAFTAMPDSLMPYLSTNNRLDMMDFMDAHMKAEVTNLLDGKSEMTLLTDDSLSIRMSDALQVDMALEKADTVQVITLRKTYRTQGGETDVVMYRYTAEWQLISTTALESTLLRRDEETFAAPGSGR